MIHKSKAFTLLETIIALAIFAFIIFMSYFGLQFFKNEKKAANLINYQRVLMQLEDPKRQYEWLEQGKQIYLLSPDREQQKIRFRLKKQVLQLTTDQGGTMPLISGIKEFSLREDHGRLHFLVIFSGEEHYESDLLLKKHVPKTD